MSARVDAAVHQLRRYLPATVEPLDRLSATVRVLDSSLERLRSTSAREFAVSPGDLVVDLDLHVRASRVLADVFDEAAKRFERTQDSGRVGLPRVFAGYPAWFVGPVPSSAAVVGQGGDAATRRWLTARFAAATGRTPSNAARRIEVGLRQQLGLAGAGPYVVAVSEHRVRLAGQVPIAELVGIGGGVEQLWTIVELSDGTALATFSFGQGADASAGAGAEFELTAGGSTYSFSQRAEVGLTAGAAQTWTKHFSSVAEATDAMEHGRLGGFEQFVLRALQPVLSPAVNWLADRVDLSGMHDAPQTATAVAVGVAGQLATAASARGSSGGVSLSAAGTVRLIEQKDREAATTTDVVAVDARLSSPIAAALNLPAAVTTAAVSVTRDDGSGTARSLTVHLAFDAAAGLQPLIGGSVAAPGVGGADAHRYDVTVEVDLTDPRNRDLAAGLSSSDGAVGRIDADLQAVERAGAIGADVLARSRITVLEQVADAPGGVSLTGPPLEGAVVNTGLRTVQAWQNLDGQLLPV